MRIAVEGTVTSFEKLTEAEYGRGLTDLEGRTIAREFGERTDDRGRYISFFDNVTDASYVNSFEAVLNG